MGTPTTLWWDSLPAELRAPIGEPLAGDRDCDVAIVGGGYTGLWTAYFLNQAAPDLRIGLIESEFAGFGASGRNGGWASALLPMSLEAIARASSRAEAVRMQRTMFDIVRHMGDVVDREGWQVDWQTGGTVVVARSPLQWQRAQQEIARLRHWGFGADDYDLLDVGRTAEHIGMTKALGAVFTPHCAAINPAKLVRHLARTVRARGVEMYESTRAERIEAGIVRTDRGAVRAPVIVRATEGYTARLPQFRRAVVPVYSLMLATAPLRNDQIAEVGLADRETFSDGRNLIIYGQRTADNRIAFGGRGAPYHFGSAIRDEFDRHPTVHAELRKILVDLFPILDDVPITHTWGGPLGIARDWWASVGFDPRTGLAWAGGYVGDGVGTSHLAGRTLSDLILGHSTELTTLPWVDHHSRRWEIEPLRWLGTNLGVRVMTHADAKEARRGRPSRTATLFARQLGH